VFSTEVDSILQFGWSSLTGEMGIVAGGMENGTVSIWDVASIAKSEG
jgi:uncharacterized protein with WD repeat